MAGNHQKVDRSESCRRSSRHKLTILGSRSYIRSSKKSLRTFLRASRETSKVYLANRSVSAKFKFEGSKILVVRDIPLSQLSFVASLAARNQFLMPSRDENSIVSAGMNTIKTHIDLGSMIGI